MNESINFPLVSERLLFAVKMKSNTDDYLNQLKTGHLSNLKEQLPNDSIKKSFWINIYNSYFQIVRDSKMVPKNEVYSRKFINISNQKFSLDDVEHGILRKYRFKYSIGLLQNVFARKIIKELAVEEIDYRIHFALNCGAKSCPPIAFYNHEKIDTQLDLATLSFLESESEFDNTNKIVYTSKLLKWYRFDFGGRIGINEMYLSQLDKNIKDFQIKYNEYSWEEMLNNFVEH